MANGRGSAQTGAEGKGYMREKEERKILHNNNNNNNVLFTQGSHFSYETALPAGPA